MATEILLEAAEKTIARMIAERAERGRQLYLTSRQLIAKTSADTYEIPSCTTDEVYAVHYGDSKEDCTCTDFGAHRGEVSCKHLTAVALLFAVRRRGSPRPSCPSCFGGYVTMTIEEDGQEDAEAVPCRRCAGEANAGVER